VNTWWNSSNMERHLVGFWYCTHSRVTQSWVHCLQDWKQWDTPVDIYSLFLLLYISLFSDAWTDSSLSVTSSSVHMLQCLKLAQREIYEYFLPFPMGWSLGNMQVGYSFYNAMYAWKYSWDVPAWRYWVLDSHISVLIEIHALLPFRLHKTETDICKMWK
jgi:hypothetical protein